MSARFTLMFYPEVAHVLLPTRLLSPACATLALKVEGECHRLLKVEY